MNYETYDTIKNALYSFEALKVKASSLFEQEEKPFLEVSNALNANIAIHSSHAQLLEALETLVDGLPSTRAYERAIKKAKELTQDD